MTLNPVVPLRRRPPSWTFGERLRKARREVGLNQADMAKRLGVKTATLGAWETGRNKPDVATLAPRLEDVTGIPRVWFLGWDDGPQPDPGDFVTSLYRPTQKGPRRGGRGGVGGASTVFATSAEDGSGADTARAA